MNTAEDLVTQFTSASLDPAKVRAFAEHIAAVEARTGIKVKKALVNGIPPFDEIPTVEFDVPKAELGDIVGHLLGNAGVRPSVVVVGIPNIDSFEVRVFGGR